MNKANISGRSFEKRYDFCTHHKLTMQTIKSKGKRIQMYRFDDTVVLKQGHFKKYMEYRHGKKRGNDKDWNPDTCFVNTERNIIHVLEMKNQTCSGSVDIKLLAGRSIRSLYQDMVYDYGQTYRVEYGFALAPYFKLQEYERWLKMMGDDSIQHFFVDDDEYYNKIRNWLHE